jgi:uncharacterized protein (DUF2141 family)
MRKIIFFLLLTSALQTQAQNSLTVNIEKIKEDKGVVLVALFSEANQFLKTPFKGQEAAISGSSATVSFENLPAGVYAVSVIHDKNTNGKLDSNFMGIPKEGFGFSNNAKVAFGPPKFEEASFKVPETKVVSIVLKYL